MVEAEAQQMQSAKIPVKQSFSSSNMQVHQTVAYCGDIVSQGTTCICPNGCIDPGVCPIKAYILLLQALCDASTFVLDF